ncbi:hypothetical protein V2G26_005744 [Clonostachys chloroleuca]
MEEEKGSSLEHRETADKGPKILADLQHAKIVDTLHNDEALKVLAAWVGDEDWEPEEEKKLVRRIDRTLLVILTLTYGLQYYDKAMLSQAALFGLRTDLELTVGERYSFSASIFYLGFIVGATPAILLAQRFPIERVCSGIVFIWGACVMCTVACKNYQSLYAQRFFLGFLESGVSPMFMLVVGGWYKRDEQALRMGIWYCATGYVALIAPLINFGLGHIKGGTLNSWQYMYVIAGAITILWGFVILFFLPPDPIRARGFTERERYIAVARLRVNNAGVRNTHFKWQQAFEVLVDIRFWLTFSMAFLIMIANGPVSTFIPIFISNFGYSTLNSLLLSMPAGVVIGTIDEKGGLLFACYILATFGGGYAVLMGLQIANTAGYTKRSVTSSGVFFGYCLGNFVGPMVFKNSDAPGYAPGFIVTVVTSIAASVLAIVYRYVCIWENGRRDKSGVGEGFDHAYEDDLTDMKNPQIRYIY